MMERGSGSTRRKVAPVPLCPPQIPHYFYPGKNRRHYGKLETSRLSCGKAKVVVGSRIQLPLGYFALQAIIWVNFFCSYLKYYRYELSCSREINISLFIL
jgi:hypothetical protein